MTEPQYAHCGMDAWRARELACAAQSPPCLRFSRIFFTKAQNNALQVPTTISKIEMREVFGDRQNGVVSQHFEAACVRTLESQVVLVSMQSEPKKPR